MKPAMVLWMLIAVLGLVACGGSSEKSTLENLKAAEKASIGSKRTAQSERREAERAVRRGDARAARRLRQEATRAHELEQSAKKKARAIQSEIEVAD
jgi:uncharacterized lipoprotein YmbA